MEWSALKSSEHEGCGTAVLQICWSNVRACCFFVLSGDATRTEANSIVNNHKNDDVLQSTLKVWDLAKNVEEPVVNSEILMKSGAPACAMAISSFTPRFEGSRANIAFVDEAGECQVKIQAL